MLHNLPPSLRREAARRETNLIRRWGELEDAEIDVIYESIAALEADDRLLEELQSEKKRRGLT